MSEDVVLTVPGIPEDEDLILPAGWSYLPISSTCNIDADALFMPIIDNIEVVKSVANFQVYWPAMSIYSLTVLQPGTSYLIKLNEATLLEFPECTDKTVSQETPVIPEFWNMVDRTPSTHIVMIDADKLSNLQAGDFVASFTENGICTGCVQLKDEPVALTIFGDDILTPSIDGMTENDILFFKAFKPKNQGVVEISVEFDEALPDFSGQFKTNGISAFKDSYNGNNGIFEASGQLSVFPNPTNGKFVVSGLAGYESIIITNMHGQEILKLQLTNSQPIEIDLRDMQKGIYFVLVTGQSGNEIRKIVVK
jgi:hypothetical protein